MVVMKCKLHVSDRRRCGQKSNDEDPDVEKAVKDIVRREYAQCGTFR